MLKLIFSFLFFCLGDGIHAIDPIISLSKGDVRGSVIEYESKRFFAFKKIPFAEPPIKELRFSKPREVNKWDGILDGTKYGPACMSNSSRTKSPQKFIDEDCLHMNIFTSEKCILSSNKCPVVFYLHGGDIAYDSAVMFNETKMVETFASKDVVLVVSAFRLGIFSHLVLSDSTLTVPNLALYDIAKGLEFVNKEITHFGGSNQQVTLFGHSYGATMAMSLVCSKHFIELHGYYQQFVMMSGLALFHDNLKQAQDKSYEFAKRINCTFTSDERILDCLRSKSSYELNSFQRTLDDEGIGYAGIVFADPLFNTKEPLANIFSNARPIPGLLGTLKLEYLRQEVEDVSQIIDFANHHEVNEKYRSDRENNKLPFNYTDKTQLTMLTTAILADSIAMKNQSAYLYQYLYPKHNVHTDDLSYIMGVHRFEMDENEQKLSVEYPQYFINFVKGNKPAENWSSTNQHFHSYYAINWNETSGLRPHMENHYEEELMNYWLTEMKEYDRYITQQKLQSPKFRNIPISDTEGSSISHYKFWLIALIVFLIGLLVGRNYCSESYNKNFYLKLDGLNEPLLEKVF